MSSILKVNELQDAGGNTILSSDGSGTVTQTRTGITEVDMWRLTNDKSDNTLITANLERCDDASFAKIGTGMSESSGIFTFPTTGLYEVKVQAFISGDNADVAVIINSEVTTNNSTYDVVSRACAGDDGGSGSVQTSAYSQCFVNVTDTSNVKIRFNVISMASGSSIKGDTDLNETSFSFIRLGDSQ